MYCISKALLLRLFSWLRIVHAQKRMSISEVVLPVLWNQVPYFGLSSLYFFSAELLDSKKNYEVNGYLQ